MITTGTTGTRASMSWRRGCTKCSAPSRNSCAPATFVQSSRTCRPSPSSCALGRGGSWAQDCCLTRATSCLSFLRGSPRIMPMSRGSKSASGSSSSCILSPPLAGRPFLMSEGVAVTAAIFILCLYSRHGMALASSGGKSLPTKSSSTAHCKMASRLEAMKMPEMSASMGSTIGYFGPGFTSTRWSPCACRVSTRPTRYTVPPVRSRTSITT
mmetsp:Transcript_110021/g.350447  ORF Transcript_110021/g.350447 Transcript_110021/m.350447 type:complete len:212 (-) Transcript_110021:1697-2332(-)